MMSNEDKSKNKSEEFKVVDRRSSSEQSENQKPVAGEGFTAKDAKEAAPSELDLSTLIYSFATGALINMGLAPDPATKKVQKNLSVAKQNIEILTILEQKTKGNLTPDESKFLSNILTEVRLRFVEASK